MSLPQPISEKKFWTRLSTPFAHWIKDRVRPFAVLTSIFQHVFDSLEEEITNFEKAVQGLRHELTTAAQKGESLNKSISSLRAQVEKSSMPYGILSSVIGIDVRQTTKLYNYNKKWTTSHTLSVFTNRSTNVKLYMQRVT